MHYSIGRSVQNKQIIALEIDVDMAKKSTARPSVAVVGGLGKSDRAAKEIVLKFAQ